jgi:hypothetical protein
MTFSEIVRRVDIARQPNYDDIKHNGNRYCTRDSFYSEGSKDYIENGEMVLQYDFYGNLAWIRVAVYRNMGIYTGYVRPLTITDIEADDWHEIVIRESQFNGWCKTSDGRRMEIIDGFGYEVKEEQGK